MSISPFLRSPMSDIVGGLTSHQLLGRCQKQEAIYMDCLEAYGLERGKIKCANLFDDYHECHTLSKQFKRFMVTIQALFKLVQSAMKKAHSPRSISFEIANKYYLIFSIWLCRYQSGALIAEWSGL